MFICLWAGYGSFVQEPGYPQMGFQMKTRKNRIEHMSRHLFMLEDSCLVVMAKRKKEDRYDWESGKSDVGMTSLMSE